MKKLKVFVLEDDMSLRFALTQVLEDSGHCVYAAGDIISACEILTKTKPDLLLLDLMIGAIDTVQVADLAGYRFPDAEVIYLTGSNLYPNGELFGLSRNASWILRKPIDFNVLKATIAHFENSRTKSKLGSSVEVNIV